MIGRANPALSSTSKTLGRIRAFAICVQFHVNNIVYVMVSNHRDVKGIDARRSWQNRFPEYFFGDFQDRLLGRQDRDTGQQAYDYFEGLGNKARLIRRYVPNGDRGIRTRGHGPSAADPSP